MDSTFQCPPITTRDLIGAVELDPVFRMTLDLEQRRTEETPRGLRIHQRVLGGMIEGKRLQGRVYPNGGGEFGLIRPDGTTEILTRFMILAANGEWLYAHCVGYERPDGYARLQATFDADMQGPHAWLNESMFIATIEDEADSQSRTLTFFEAI